MAEESRHGTEHSHRASHGHSHHHSSHSSRHQPKSKLAKFCKKHKSLLTSLLIVAVSAAIMTVLVIAGERRYQALEDSITKPSEEGVKVTVSSIGIEVPLYGSEMRLVDTPVWACITADANVPLNQIIEQYRRENTRLDAGVPVELSYEITAIPENLDVQSAVVEVSEDAAFTKTRSFELAANQRKVSVPLLKTATRYYYRVNVYLTDGTHNAVQGSFRTAQSPRILSISGIANVRDVGGWKTVDGKTVRQGLLYRGSELDGAVDGKFKLTDNGKLEMLTVLGIRTEMDLRGPGVGTVDALAANVKHLDYAAMAYDTVFTDAGKQVTRQIFGDLAQPEMYPAYLHCTLGADRTGTVCYLLGALLGVRQEDLVRDYELTALYYPSTTRDNLKVMQYMLDAYPGNTLQEKTENYLLSAGVTEDQLLAIRNIFLEG